MTQCIDKSALVAEINNWIKDAKRKYTMSKVQFSLSDRIELLESLLSFLDTLEVKEVKDNSLEKFKSLQHISGDLKQTLEDWGYAPNLYYFDGSWHVDWISCEEGDALIDFSGSTPKEAIDKACDWFHSTFCNG